MVVMWLVSLGCPEYHLSYTSNLIWLEVSHIFSKDRRALRVPRCSVSKSGYVSVSVTCTKSMMRQVTIVAEARDHLSSNEMNICGSYKSELKIYLHRFPLSNSKDTCPTIYITFPKKTKLIALLNLYPAFERGSLDTVA